MKKLMIAIAVIATAVIAQAAAVEWGSAKMYKPTSADGGWGTTAAGTSVSGSLWLLTESQYNSFLSSYGEDGNMQSVYDYFTTGAGKDTAATKTGTSGSRTSAITMSTDGDVGSTYYAAVIYTTTAQFDGKDVDFYIANIGTASIESDMGASLGNLALYAKGASSGTAMGWTAVPEPTSGLLMLLGMAGLALRRRRA